MSDASDRGKEPVNAGNEHLRVPLNQAETGGTNKTQSTQHPEPMPLNGSTDDYGEKPSNHLSSDPAVDENGDEVDENGVPLYQTRSVQEMPPFPGMPRAEPVQTADSTGKRSDTEDYPEGGTRAWLVVLGAWTSMIATFGMVNCGGPIQAWLSTHQLKHMSESQISWIFSVYAFLFFFGGVQVGPVFDSHGLKYVVLPGSIGSVLSVFFLSVSKKYYQIMLGYGVLGGFSASLIFTPAIACIGHFFNQKRGLSTGMAATGGAVGGIAFPLAMNKMFSELSFGWTIRVIGFVNLALLTITVFTLRTRLPLNKEKGAAMDFSAFKDKRFTFTTFGIFMIEFGIFVPVNYLTTYSLNHGMSSDMAYRMVVFLNCGSILGRLLPGWFADLFGRFNVMIITVVLCAISCLAVWLPAGDNMGATVAFAVLFGLFSGSGISLAPVCISQICKTSDYGKRYGTCYFFASIGVLVGLPIAGAILERQNGSYQGLTIFSGLCYFVGGLFFAGARVCGGGKKIFKIY